MQLQIIGTLVSFSVKKSMSIALVLIWLLNWSILLAIHVSATYLIVVTAFSPFIVYTMRMFCATWN